MAKHDVHHDASGRHAWVEGNGHCACGGGHELTPANDACPQGLPNVVLRCRCDDGERHAAKGEHCPEAEIDVAASYEVSVDFNPVQVQ